MSSRQWSIYEDALLLEAPSKGLELKDISRKLDLTNFEVLTRLQELKLVVVVYPHVWWVRSYAFNLKEQR